MIKFKTVAICRSHNDSILSIEGYMNGSPVKFALDSRAVESIISKRTCERLGLEVFQSDVLVKTATDELKKVVGETKEIIVDVEGHTCRMLFLVLDMEDHEVLLGLNWFEQTGAGIFPSEKILRFPGHTVHLLKDEMKFERFDDSVEVYLSEVIDEADIDEDIEWNSSKIPEFNPEFSLSEDQLKKFYSLMKKNLDMFGLSIDDLGECVVREHIIM